MKEEKIKEVEAKLNNISDTLDKIGVNTEIIQNFILLIDDKIQEIRDLEANLGLPQNELYKKLWGCVRYSSCYISLSYKLTDEVIELNKNKDDIFNEVKEINTILDNIKSLKEMEG